MPFGLSSHGKVGARPSPSCHTSRTQLERACATGTHSSRILPQDEFESRKQKAGQNFYRSDLLKLLVAGTGFEPMTFGLQEQRRPPCFFLFSAFLGIPGLSSARVIRYSLPIFSPIPCWGVISSPFIPMARKPLLTLLFYRYDARNRNDGHRQPEIMVSCRSHPPTLCRSPSPYGHANTISTTQLLAENASRGASELRQSYDRATTSSDKAMTELRHPPIPTYKTGLGQLRKTRATRTARHRRKVL